MKNDKIAFTFASSEVNIIAQNFIKFAELCTGKLTLKKLYDQYLKENNPPEYFWHDAIKILKLNLIPHYHSPNGIPSKGRLIVVANHAFGVVDGVSICSLISDVRQDYKMITHKVLGQAQAVKKKIIPIDFSSSRKAVMNNLEARKSAENFLNEDGLIVIFPSGTIATKSKLKKNIKADDGNWKNFTSKLAVRTHSPILPIFFEGQNSQLFHIANKIGQTLRYSLMMYELKRKIGDTVHLHIGDLIDTKKLREIGDINQITTFIRDQTYSLDPT